jgi:hypothetical protein
MASVPENFKAFKFKFVPKFVFEDLFFFLLEGFFKRLLLESYLVCLHWYLLHYVKDSFLVLPSIHLDFYVILVPVVPRIFLNWYQPLLVVAYELEIWKLIEDWFAFVVGEFLSLLVEVDTVYLPDLVHDLGSVQVLCQVARHSCISKSFVAVSIRQVTHTDTWGFRALSLAYLSYIAYLLANLFWGGLFVILVDRIKRLFFYNLIDVDYLRSIA